MNPNEVLQRNIESAVPYVHAVNDEIFKSENEVNEFFDALKKSTKAGDHDSTDIHQICCDIYQIPH